MKAKYLGCNGTDYDKERANTLLEVNKWYELHDVDQHNWRTDIFIGDFDEGFNSVMFDYDDDEEFDRLCSISFEENYRL